MQFQAIAHCYEDVCWLSVYSYVSLWVSNESGFDGDICWGSVSSYVNLWVSNKSEFLLINMLSLILKLINFVKFKQKRIVMKTFADSQFEVM